jgi:enoyl-CoA hydratase/carnithine racemase
VNHAQPRHGYLSLHNYFQGMGLLLEIFAWSYVMNGINLSINHEGIGILKIDRPSVRNALNWATMNAFASAIETAHRSRDLKTLILTGAGTSFVSGGDLSELVHYPRREDGLRLATIMGDALKRLEELACPTIAAINGPARGGGAEMAVACDLRIISEDADIGFVHARLGIITAWGGAQRLMRLVGYANALELMTTARVLSAKEAVRLGLASLMTPVGQALAEAKKLATEMAANPPAAVQAAKRALRNGLMQSLEQALISEREEFPALWDTDFRRKAVARFLDKSKSKVGSHAKTLAAQASRKRKSPNGKLPQVALAAELSPLEIDK